MQLFVGDAASAGLVLILKLNHDFGENRNLNLGSDGGAS